jgi:predicted GH43/DUF377 family glycosyl hydrolase
MKFKWEKQGLLFDPRTVKNREWLQLFAQGPATLELDDRLRVYFSCRPKPDDNGQYVSYSAFVDFTKDHQFQQLGLAEQPILTLGDVGDFDEFGIYPTSVIKSDKGYLAFYGGWTRCESVPFNVAIGVARSDDACHFERIGPGPVLSYSAEEPFIISGPKIRKFNDTFYLFYIAGREWVVVNDRPEPVYKIRSAESKDGIHWVKHNKDLISNVLGDHEAQASPDVFFLHNRYHMFFCYRKSADYRLNKANSYRIGYAWSDNLLDWHRDDNCAGIAPSDSGWDSDMVAYPHVFMLDQQLYMFYLGNEVGKYGFGLAKLAEIITP